MVEDHREDRLHAGLDEAEALAGAWDATSLERGASLALAELNAGNGQAGVVYARCRDRLAVVRSRPQPYGTASYERVGELWLYPIDDSVTDEERVHLGVPTVAERRAEVHAENRRRAEGVAESGSLPDGAEYRRVWREWSHAELAIGLQPVVTPDPLLLFVHRGVAQQVDLAGGIQVPLWEVPGERVWAAAFRFRELDRVALRYCFIVDGREPGPSEWREWRGRNAPAPPAEATAFAGHIETALVKSDALREQRRVTLYIPPHNPVGIMYMADGQFVDSFAPVVDRAVTDGRVPPVVLVGAHPAAFVAGVDRRAEEYLPGLNAVRFDAHCRFFSEELITWAESTIPMPTRRQNRAVFGLSNGAAFALEICSRYPERFSTVVAFSVALPPSRYGGRPPRHYLLAGTLEEGFRYATAKCAERLSSQGVEYVHRERVCGHDALMWKEEFPHALTWAFDG